MTTNIPMHPNRSRPGCVFEYIGDKDWKKFQKKLWDQGWWPNQKNNCILWCPPSGTGHLTVHGSSSDHHALPNAKSEARKLGAVL